MKAPTVFFSTALGATLLVATSRPQDPPPPPPVPPAPSPSAITPDEIQAHVDFLASDLLQGRKAGTRGAELAAQYLAGQFRQLGLKPAAESFLIGFELPGGAQAGEPVLSLGEERMSGSSLARAARSSALGSFSGHLVSQGGDPQGNLVLVDGWEGERQARKTAKELVAAGALGVFFIDPSAWLPEERERGHMGRLDGLSGLFPPGESEGAEKGEAGEGLEALPEAIREQLTEKLEEMGIDLDNARVHIVTGKGEGEELPFDPEDLPDGLPGSTIESKIVMGGPAMLAGGARLAAPVVRVSRLVGDALLEAAGKGEKLSLEVPQRGEDHSANVVGVLEGSDPELRKEYIVVGAHYDHLGASGDGKVWNGADDNASGTAAVLEIAEALAFGAERPRRSILFAAWGAEEAGLVGSSAFARKPPVPLEQIAAYINLDMIARNDPAKIGMLDASEELRGWGEEAAGRNGFTPSRIASFFLNASDSGPFVQRKVPTLSFFSGMHRDYHHASDDPDTIDADKAARVSRCALEVVRRAAGAEKRPGFSKPKSAGFSSIDLGGDKPRKIIRLGGDR